jgi:hypothetical protein
MAASGTATATPVVDPLRPYAHIKHKVDTSRGVIQHRLEAIVIPPEWSLDDEQERVRKVKQEPFRPSFRLKMGAPVIPKKLPDRRGRSRSQVCLRADGLGCGVQRGSREDRGWGYGMPTQVLRM